MINSEKMEVELGNLKISLTSIGGMICWSIFFNVSCTDSAFMYFQELDPGFRKIAERDSKMIFRLSKSFSPLAIFK